MLNKEEIIKGGGNAVRWEERWYLTDVWPVCVCPARRVLASHRPVQDAALRGRAELCMKNASKIKQPIQLDFQP